MGFGWEHATAIMSVSGILIAAIIKFVPIRHTCIQESRMQDIKSRIDKMDEKMDKKFDKLYDLLLNGEIR